MPTKTWIATTSTTWNTGANWSPSGVPAATDDVIFNSTYGGACSLDTTNGTCNSLVMTGYTGTFTMNAVTLTISGSDTGTTSGNSLSLGSGATYSQVGSPTISFTSSTGGQITSAGKSLGGTILSITGTGTHTFTDNLAAGTTTFNTTTGTVIINGNVTLGGTTLTSGTLTVTSNPTFSTFSSNNSNTRTINMGPGTWTLTAGGTAWQLATTTNLTLNSQQSRILCTNSSGLALAIQGGGQVYYTLEFSRGTSTAGCTIVGANTFANFIDNTTAAHTILFGSSTTHTFYNFRVRGSAGNVITLTRQAAGAANLVKAGQGLVSMDYVSVSSGNVTCSPANTWYAGANYSGTGGSNWVLSAAPSSQSLGGVGGVG